MTFEPLYVITGSQRQLKILGMKIGFIQKPALTTFCDFVGCYDKHIAYIEELDCWACPKHVILYSERYDKNLLRKAKTG